MKILRFIFAIPLGMLLSFLSFYVVNVFTNVAKFVNTSNYPIADYLSTLISGIVLISAVTYIAPAKRKLFLFIALVIGLMIFISNIIFIKDIQFAFIIGVVSTFLYVFKEIKKEGTIVQYESVFRNSNTNEEKDKDEKYISEISQLNIFESKNENMIDNKNIDVSERAKRAINKSKRK